MKKVLFLRKKTEGQNSMEELAYTLIKYIPDLELRILPYYSTSIVGMIKNSIFAYKNRGDVNHIFSITDAYLCMSLPGRKIVTCHDVGTLKSLSFIGRIVAKVLWIYLPSLFWTTCTCISNQVAKELLSIIPWAKKKIEVIYNPINPLFIPHEKDNLNNPPVILHIGTAKRKNLKNVIEALKGLQCELIIVGILFPEQQKALKSTDYPHRLYKDISLPNLIELYNYADIISFPSSYEGFGMPIIEGNAVGRAVIAGDIPVLHEIAGDAAYFVDPLNIKELHKAFAQTIFNADLRKKLCSNGFINIARFKADNIANQYNKLYDSNNYRQ